MTSLGLLTVTVCWLALAWASLRLLIQEPLNVAAGAVFLCVLFYLFPAMAWMYGYEAGFAYGFGTAGADVRIHGQLAPLVMALASTALLLLGAMWDRLRPVRRPRWRPEPRRMLAAGILPSGTALTVGRPTGRGKDLLVALLAVWVVVMLLVQRQSGLTLLELIMPFRKAKADVYGSFYILYVALLLPLAVGMVLYVRAERMVPSALICFGLSALVSLGTAQRRNVLVVCLFVVALHFTRRKVVAPNLWDRLRGGRPRTMSRFRARMAITAAACLALGPLLWWARNWFSGLVDPYEEIVFPWERKSFFELLFGSAGAGFPTLLLVREWMGTDGVQWGVSLLATLSVFVPRQLWPDKPAGAEVLLQQHFGLETMPSMFLINELYLNSGPLVLPMAMLAGWGLSRVYRTCVERGGLRSRAAIVSMFANLVTLFKNGLGPFCVNVVFLTGLCWLALLQDAHVTKTKTAYWFSSHRGTETRR